MSFRTKIALLAGSITGGIILGSVWLLWNITYHFNIETIDKEAHHIIQSNIGKAAGVSFWKRLDDSLAQFSHDAAGDPLFRLWVEPHGRKVYLSADWPEQIDPRPHFTVLRPVAEEAANPSIRKEKGLGQSDLVKLSSLNRYSENVHWRIVVYYSAYGNLAVAFNVDAFNIRMNSLKRRFLAVSSIAILMAITGAWFVAGRSLRPLNVLTSSVESVTSQELSHRVEEVGHEKEFHRLVAVFNKMMERMEKSFHQASRFSADASHELKTPIARLQMELEKAMKGSSPGSKEQKVYSSLLDEIRHLSNIISHLTLLSRSDAGKLPLTLVAIDLCSILENVVEDWKTVKPNQEFEISARIPVMTSGDGILIEQAIQNLVSNAVLHGGPNSKIRIELSEVEQEAILSITNDGPPIPRQHQAQLFDRFFRVDSSGNLDRRATGLGLSLTREIARAHGGEVSLRRSDAKSTRFELRLPARKI